MRGAAALGLALFGALAVPGGEELRGATEAGVLDGLWGLSTVSELRLAAAPDDPHVLEIALAFPDRARWTLRRAGTGDRRIEYRFGEHGFVVALASDSSTSLADGERESLLRRTRLRQAAFLWPRGAHWAGDGDLRVAPLHGIAGEDPKGGLGRLEAQVDASGRPSRIQSFDAQGALEETLEVLAWQDGPPRTWPRRVRLAYRGEVVWEETVTRVRPGVRLEDRYFVPPDRHAILRPNARPERARRPAAWAQRRALAERTGWCAAREAAAALRDQVTSSLGSAAERLDPVSWVVCDGDGRPISVEVRVRPLAGEEPPAGWTGRPASDAMRLVLVGTTAPGPEDRARLRAAVPPERSLEEWMAGLSPGAVLLDLVLGP